MSDALRQAQNNAEVIGTVKKVQIEEKMSKNNEAIILGHVIVEVVDGDHVNNIKCRLFSKKFKKDGNENGLYKGYKTVKDEYEPGTRVRVNGELVINEYYNQGGDLISFNEMKAVFFNRLEDERPDKAIVTLETVVEGYTSEIDYETQLPTGNLEVDAFTVGFNGSIIPLKNLIITQDLAQTFQNMYMPGSTGRLTLKINNYAEVVTEEVTTQGAGFGSAERVEANVVNNYTTNLQIIGGDLPYTDGVNNYTPAEIEQAHKVRELALQQLKESSMASSTPITTSGFGSNGLSPEKQQQVDSAVDTMFNAFNASENDPGHTNVDDVPSF